MSLPEGVDLYINEDGILEPLSLFVLRDSRVDLFPRTKALTAEIPGRHGEINFGSKLEPRLLELSVAVDEELAYSQREAVKRGIASHLNPTQGAKVLVFADEPDKQYFVKYAGVIELSQHASWFEFTIPFKCSDPYVYRTTEEVAWSNQQAAVGVGDVYNPEHTGEISLYNFGNTPVPVIVTVKGESNSPSIAICGNTLQWDEEVEDGKELVINTGNFTVVYDGNNALRHFNNVFPKLQPGDNAMTVSGGGEIVFTWIEKWA